MKTKIEIEIETEGFLPLYDQVDPTTGEIADADSDMSEDRWEQGKIVFSEQQFHNELKREIDNMFDNNIPENIIESNFPDGWEYLDDCCKKLSIKLNGNEIRGYLLHRKQERASR